MVCSHGDDFRLSLWRQTSILNQLFSRACYDRMNQSTVRDLNSPQINVETFELPETIRYRRVDVTFLNARWSYTQSLPSPDSLDSLTHLSRSMYLKTMLLHYSRYNSINGLAHTIHPNRHILLIILVMRYILLAI